MIDSITRRRGRKIRRSGRTFRRKEFEVLLSVLFPFFLASKEIVLAHAVLAVAFVNHPSAKPSRERGKVLLALVTIWHREGRREK